MSQNQGWRVSSEGLAWQAFPREPLAPGWARLRLVVGGLCGTDKQILEGYASFSGVLGHEFVAEVVECQQAEWLGRRVVGEINVGCGRCSRCQVPDGQRFCDERRVLGLRGLDGAFAESFDLPLGNLFAVDDLDPQLACFCEPLAAALEVLEHVPSGSEVLVMGDGRLGSLIGLVLAAHSRHQVLLLGRHRQKLRRLESLGLTVATALPVRQWPVVVEATGSCSALAQAFEVCQPQGTVVVKSTVAQAQELNWSPVVIKALKVIGSRCGPFGPALEWLRRGRVDPRPLVDKILPLAQVPEGLAGMREQGWVKVLISADQSAAGVDAGSQ